jgi:hypothetical protein
MAKIRIVLLLLGGLLPLSVSLHAQEDSYQKHHKSYLVASCKIISSGLLSFAFAINGLKTYAALKNQNGTHQGEVAYLKDHGKELSLSALNGLGSLYLCFKSGLYSVNTLSKLLEM